MTVFLPSIVNSSVIGLLVFFLVCRLVLGDNVLNESCGVPELKNGRVIPHRRFYNKGDVVKIVCHPGFYTLHESTQGHSRAVNVTCEGNGSWNGTKPSCNIRDYIRGKEIILKNGGTFRFDETNKTCKDLDFSNDNITKVLHIMNVSDNEDFSGALKLIVKIAKKNAAIKLKLLVDYSTMTQRHDWIPCVNQNYAYEEETETVLFSNCKETSDKKLQNIRLKFQWENGLTKIELCSIIGLGLDIQANESVPLKSSQGVGFTVDHIFFIISAIVVSVCCVALLFLYRARKRKMKTSEHIYESVDDFWWHVGHVFRNFLSLCRRHVFTLGFVTTPAPVGQSQNQSPRHFNAQPQEPVNHSVPVHSAQQREIQSKLKLGLQLSEDRSFLMDDSVIYADVNDLPSYSASF